MTKSFFSVPIIKTNLNNHRKYLKNIRYINVPDNGQFQRWQSSQEHIPWYQYRKVGICRKVLSQVILTWNIKAFAITVQKLMARVTFSEKMSNSKFKVNDVGTHGKVLSQSILMWNIKALAFTVQRLLASYKFSENWSISKVKITGLKY